MCMKKKHLIGIIAPVLARVFMQDILRGAISQIRLCGCDAVILAPLIQFENNAYAHSQTELEIFRNIGWNDIDAFLYLKDESTMGVPVIAEIEHRLIETQKYVMTVDERTHSVFDSTQYDDYDDFGKVVEHLIEVHGYKRIYCLTGPKDSLQAQTRLQAWKDRMTQHDLYYDDTYYEYGTFWYDSVAPYAEKLFSGKLPMPEAIVCGNDVMAVSLIKTLTSGGIQVPEDVAVTGYDGYPFTANLDVSLTTYSRNHFQLGADAVRRLYRNMTGLLCDKVDRQKSGFMIGSSCGCTNIPTQQLLTDQNTVVPRMWSEFMFGISMAPSLVRAKTIPDILNCALYHSKDLYQMQKVCIYLCDSSGEYRYAASCEADGTPQIHKGILSLKSASDLLSVSEEPEIVFVSPLHMNERKFGLISLSFGEHDRVYDANWLHYVTVLAQSLEILYITDPDAIDRNTASEGANSRSSLNDKLSCLRKKLKEAPSEHWTVEMLCEECGLPKSTLQKHYKQMFGKSMFEELIEFRVEMAKQLLAKTEYSLSEISDMCGYSTESYFMKQFKRITNQTPTEFRRGLSSKKH